MTEHEKAAAVAANRDHNVKLALDEENSGPAAARLEAIRRRFRLATARRWAEELSALQHGQAC